ncbi:PRC-barrel domain-containing protein [Streptomyces spinosus]|uniref:PRC-barrel domain-containing protein n=1 Tax=Streptomyces spinosus TaxID=2872623 RepID=UPI001CEDF7BA|nr:PRC-barrel domain-containing protein [Streptomyces spinosus]
MTRYVRASELVKKPVVTFDGEDVAQVKDILFEAADGSVRGFTLAGRGLFSGPLKQTLAAGRVHGLGPDAVVIRDGTALSGDDQPAVGVPGGGDVMGATALTVKGTELGKVVDVIIEGSRQPVVAGYEVESSGPPRRRVLLPVLRPVGVSGDMVVVPDAVVDFAAGDLAGFAEAARGLRHRLEEE